MSLDHITKGGDRAVALSGACLLALALGQFSSGVNLVEVYATVTSDSGAAVTGLSSNDFEVFEDGELQRITTFVAGDVPLAVALAIDRSFSMAGESLAMARSAAHSFLGVLRPSDRSMILAIGSEVETIADLSSDRPAQYEALGRLDSWGTTSLHDAIVAAVDAIQPAGGRRALVVLSDGVDRYSRATADEVREHVRRMDVMVYPVALGRTRPVLFVELAAVSGGRSFHLRAPRELDATFRAIAEELRFQYLLGYVPSRPIVPGDRGWRAISVRVSRPGVRVRARNGYVAD